MKLIKENKRDSTKWLWGVALPITLIFLVISVLSFTKITYSDESVADLLVTTHKGELLEVDLETGATRLMGDAGYWNGREPGWTSLSFDSTGRLFVVSRVRSELSEVAHLYRVDPADGAIVEEVGSTGFPYLSDIDFALDDSLYGSYWEDWGGVLLIDPATATSTVLLNFGDDEITSGGISVHPMTGELWSVESGNAPGRERIFRLDQETGAPIEETMVRLGLNGIPVNIGFSALTITPEGRFFGIGGVTSADIDLYEIEPAADMASGLAELTHIPLDIPEEVDGIVTGIEFIFQGIEVDIDINPDDPDNRVRLSNRGTLTVAILSTEGFDAMTIDPATVALAGSPVITKRSGKLAASFEDVNRDLLVDLVLHVATKDLKIRRTGKVAILYGQTFDGTYVRGVDPIDVVSR